MIDIGHSRFDSASPSNSPPVTSSAGIPGSLVTAPDRVYDIGGLGRGFYRNDQRIQFTGQEATFAVEGVLWGTIERDWHSLTTSANVEIFLNQPFERNLLADTAERRSYLANFDIEPLEISQLYFEVHRGILRAGIGRMITPFGRAYFPLLQNDFSDGPFLRTEPVLWRETGVLVGLNPGPLSVTAAITNGGEERDANSSKAFIGRIGLDTDAYAIGASIKVQDGTGSENQKLFRNHVGVDAMVRRGPWTLSGEAIYDQYGFRRPFDPLDVFWGRSLYYREQYIGWEEPITGVGYYVNLGYDGPRWMMMLNFGQYFPKQIGDPRHDATNDRGIIKAIYHFNEHTDGFCMAIVESELPVAQVGKPRRGWYVLAGFQYAL